MVIDIQGRRVSLPENTHDILLPLLAGENILGLLVDQLLGVVIDELERPAKTGVVLSGQVLDILQDRVGNVVPHGTEEDRERGWVGNGISTALYAASDNRLTWLVTRARYSQHILVRLHDRSQLVIHGTQLNVEPDWPHGSDITGLEARGKDIHTYLRQ